MNRAEPTEGTRQPGRAASRPPPRKPGEVVLVCMSVVAALALAAAILVPNVFCSIGCGGTARALDNASNQLASLGGAIELYVLDNDSLPPDLEALTVPSRRSGEPFIAKVPPDPWGNGYGYRPLDRAKRAYELRSAGPDGRLATEDDLVYPEPTPR